MLKIPREWMRVMPSVQIPRTAPFKGRDLPKKKIVRAERRGSKTIR